MSTETAQNALGALSTLTTGGGKVDFYRLSSLADRGVGEVDRLPMSIKVLLESVLRNVDGTVVTEEHVAALAGWGSRSSSSGEIPFIPSRVLLQDFTGVPAVVDLAAMRDAMAALGGDPKLINPLIPVDLVIDHSIQVDVFAALNAVEQNSEREFVRNKERYQFLRWGQQAFDNFRVIPPATGIVHQVNLEYLASVVASRKVGGRTMVMPDSLVGTDSHTTMVNALGVVAWGVGGIEAEAVMLGQPIYMLLPDVVGFKLIGELPVGATATDLVLTVTEILRNKGVVGKFVEFFGPGLDSMSLPDRATVANMAPEYGATMGFFPIDTRTIDYLRLTARPAELIDLVERYTKEQGLFRSADTPEPDYTSVVEMDLGAIEPCLAGPKRPQDRVRLADMKSSFQASLTASPRDRGFGQSREELGKKVSVEIDGETVEMGHGAVAIAAITSCTNTSNPSVMVAAGLVAKKASELGLSVKPYVKTSLSPGSRVVTDYFNDSGLTQYLEEMGFHTVGYGCMTCIGNSGPLPEPVAKAITEGDLIAAGVLSGNRNFEGRIHAQVKANYLASPPLVVAYAIAGTTDIDLTTEPLGVGKDGQEVWLRDIWPTQDEIQEVVRASVTSDKFRDQYANVLNANEQWNNITGAEGDTYSWDDKSTYIQNPPFFDDMERAVQPIGSILKARALAVLGDSVTTDHISPAGAFAADSPAGNYLRERGVKQGDFNSFGSRRGNDRIMTRGTFGNIRLRNLLAPGTEGGVTIHLPSGDTMSIYEAAQRYKQEGTPLVVLAGKEYGTGSSRDWAAKGTLLLGVRAVIAESFERIHRSNLVGMGVLPLQFLPGESVASLGLTGRELFDFEGLGDDLQPGQELEVRATDPDDGTTKSVRVVCRIDTNVEVDYYRNGGILPTVLRKLAGS